MDGVLLAARLVLAVVFAFAGLAKLTDLAGSRRAVTEFGLPAALSLPVGILLPLAEIAIAVLLIPTRTAWGASIAALALLGIFIIAIAVNLARGRKPDCHCFGQVVSAPIGWSTLVRNAILGAVAAVIVAGGRTNAGTSAVDWLNKLDTAEQVGLGIAIALAALLLAQWGFLLNLLRQNGRLLERMEALENSVATLGTGFPVGQTAAAPMAPPQPVFGLPVGTPAPPFVLSGLYGETMTLDSLRAQDKPVLVIFTDPGCGPCGELLPEIGRWQREYESRLTVALISRGAADANRAKTAEHGIRNVLLQSDDEVAQAYQSPGTPSAVMIQADGNVGSPASPGVDGIRQLVTGLMGAPAPVGQPVPLLDEMPTPLPAAGGGNGSEPVAPPATVRVGEMPPAIVLKDVDNRAVDLSQLRGETTLLLFWNLGCGFCQQMLPDLKEWEKNKPEGAPRVILVSSGSVEDNRAMALKSTVLLDQNFQAGQAFGAQGTPMGIMIDANGHIASEVAAGAPGVWGLVGSGPSGGEVPAVPAAPPAPVKVGDSAPTVKLPDINGKTVNLSDFRGSNTLMIFWSNGCGFCQQMLPDLKTWEKSRPKDAPKLLIVSSGTPDENRALDLKSTIVLDQNFQTGSAFGANGTPMGVLIDPNGSIASEVAAGAEAVFTLAGRSPAGAQPLS